MKANWAVLGGLFFGAVIPALSWWLWRYDFHFPIGLGIAFAGYVSHAFLATARHHTWTRWVFFIPTVLIGLGYEFWFEHADRLVGLVTYRFESTPAPGTPGGFEVTTSVTPMVTGSVMGILLFGTTKSVQVLVTTLAASLLCGLWVLPTLGFTCVPWNISVSIAVYLWARTFPSPRPKLDPLRCTRCGYSLLGLAPHSPCPECGSPANSTT